MADGNTHAQRLLIDTLISIADAITMRDHTQARGLLAAATVMVLGNVWLLEYIRRWYRDIGLVQSDTEEGKALRLATFYLFERAVSTQYPDMQINRTDRNFTRTSPTFGRVYSLTFSDSMDEGSMTDTVTEAIGRFFSLSRQERLLRIARFLASGPYSVISLPTTTPPRRLRIFTGSRRASPR